MINRVLVVASEQEIDDTVDEITDDYHRLVGRFVNLILEEVQSANPQWRALQQDLTATVLSTTNNATITGATAKSQLVRVHDARRGCLLPIVFDITDPNNPAQLIELKLAEIKYRQILEASVTASTSPSYFAIDDTSTDVMRILVHPKPTTTRTIRLVMTVPQPRFTDSDLDVAIKVPDLPIELGALWWALQERGEELGVSNVFTEERYRNALDAAITLDLSEQGADELVPV